MQTDGGWSGRAQNPAADGKCHDPVRRLQDAYELDDYQLNSSDLNYIVTNRKELFLSQ